MKKMSRETKQKQIITEVVDKAQGFFSAEDIFNSVKKQDTRIGVATVYRFLKEFRKKNKLYPYICDRRMLYSKEKKSHCHYVCEKTGKIIHFELDNLDFLKHIRSKIPGTINSFQLEIRGICKDCEK